MKNLIPTCTLFCFLVFAIPLLSNGEEPSQLIERKVPERLLAKYDTDEARKHPEHGILPFNAPCTDCIELIEKRTLNTREFVRLPEGKGYKETFMQKSLGDLNYMDEKGFLRTKDPRFVQEGEHVLAARRQPFPVVVNLGEQWVSITNLNKELRFNKDVSLVWVNKIGETLSMGRGDWSRMSKSENFTETNLLFTDFYPGIDLAMVASFGKVKTSFVIRNKPVVPAQFADGWITMSQQVEIPQGLKADLTASIADGPHRKGAINVVDDQNLKYFDFTRAIAFDARSNADNYLEMPFSMTGNQLDYYVPVSWMQSPNTLYPITIDPFVSSSSTLPQASITGSGFTASATCDTGGCSYFLNNVMTPPNCEITAIECYFSYLANLPCIRDDGGFDITMTNPNGSSCTTRNFTCLGGIQGACFFWPAQLLNAVPPLAPCVLPPQCAPYPLDFEMKFRRCNWVPIVPCDATCILANSDWTITLVGRTVELTNVTLPQTICEGQCTNLAATADWGVPLVVGTNNYTFTWQPGALVGDVVNVCPVTTTHYTVTVTDLCGVTDTGSTDVTVVNNQNPGFTISPNDTVCTNTPMTFSGLGAAAATSYDWILSCPAASGFNDQQNLNWTAPGTTGSCTATLTFQVVTGTLTCSFAQTQNFVVEPGSQPTANITPTGAVCPGQAVTFTANTTNGGSSPVFQWFVNGVAQGSNADTLAITAPGSQFTVSVLVNSNSTCANPDTVSTLITVPVTGAVVPGVLVTAAPTTICPGDPVTFTAAETNGGATPTYQWQLNGSNIAGATNSTYTGNPNAGDVFGVIMTSSLSCVNPTTASDTETVAISANVAPGVGVTANQPNVVCAGTSITFTAAPSNAGATPTYQWEFNGTAIAGETNITYTTTAQSGIYGVVITSSLACSNPNTANDTMLITVVATVVPAVSITATVDTVCAGDLVTFTATPVNGGPSPSYQWTVDGNLAGGNYDTLNVTSPSTSYNVSVQIISNAACPSPATATANYSINVRPTPVPGVTITLSDDTVCTGTPVSFTATPSAGGTAPTYQWLLNNNPIAGATNTTYNTTPTNSTDVYSVTMTSNALCVSPPTATTNASIVVISNAPPDVQVTSNVGQVVCDNTPMTFTAAPTNGGNNPGYQWLLNGSPIAGATSSTYTPTLPVTTGSIFECVLTTSLACAIPTTDNDTLEMTILPLNPTNVGLVSTDDTICTGSPVTFTANPSGGGTDPVYAWTINGTAVTGNDTSFLSSTTMANGDVVGVTMTSDIPCSSPANTTYTINVLPNPVPSISQTSAPASVCVGDVITFSATGVNGGTAPVYQWYVNGNPVAGATSTTYTGVLNDGDVVSVEMTSNAECANPVQATSNQITAEVIPYVTPAVSILSSMVNDSICLGQNVTFDATGLNGGPSPVYAWYLNGVDQGVNGPTFSSNTLVQNDQIMAVLISSEPCLTQPSANSNVILVNVYPPLNLIAAGDATICPYEPVTLTAVGAGGDGGPYNYLWSESAGNTPTVIVTPAVTTQYFVTISDECGSAPVEDSVLVNVNPSPEANLTYRPLEPSSLAPDVDFKDLSINPITWQWSFGDGDSSTIPDPTHTYAEPGDYEVTLIVTNIYGCIDSVKYRVIVKEDISVFIPNSFTPNSDGRNEFFTPMGSSLEDFDFWIFNRWGEEIFHGNETSPWLGLSQRTGKPAPEDTYVYKVDLKYSKFGKRYVTGKVSLIY